jgi:AraC-like DNA-binding protein
VTTELPPVSRVLCDTGLLRVGTFAVHPSDPRFASAGDVQGHEVVFPRTSVVLHRDRQRLVADPTVVTYYNRGETCSRTPASAEGDRCDWFAVAPEVLLEAVRVHDPTAEQRPDRPFPFTHGPSDAASYRWQRLAVLHAGTARPVDALLVEELVLRALGRVLRRAFARRGAATPQAPSPARARDLAQRVQASLADRYAEPLGLAALAAEVGCSPFHLCRAFRAATGTSLARWRHQLRLRRALELAAEPGADLTAVALDCGFSSHSHFTAAFRTAFGEPPSAFRRRASTARLAAAARRLQPAPTSVAPA